MSSTPLAGYRVVEVAMYAMVPSAGAILADWGAEVIKIEHPDGGDPIRNLDALGIPPGTGGFTYLWEFLNRNKRSVAFDLTHPEGRQLLYELVNSADVFLTSFMTDARVRLGIDVDDLMKLNERLIYARGTGYGYQGPKADRGGFDGICYWHGTGMSESAAPREYEEALHLPAPAFGDIQTGVAMAAGIAAALAERERTGVGLVVDSSLYASGIWAMGPALAAVNVIGADRVPQLGRYEIVNPLASTYRTADGRHIALAMLQPDRYWARLCDVLGAHDLAASPDFADYYARKENAEKCMRALDDIFAVMTLAEATAVLEQQDGPWEVVKVVGDLNHDEQAWANGYLQRVHYEDGRELTLATAPIHFDTTPPTMRPAPDLGAHTEEVLLGMGHDWDDIIRLKMANAIL